MSAPKPHGEVTYVCGASTDFEPDWERRDALRVALPFRVTLRGTDTRGRRFETKTLVDNLSTSRLYVRLAKLVAPNTRIFIVVRLSTKPSDVAQGPYVALRGAVQRVDLLDEGRVGLAIEFTQHRFLYPRLGE